MRILLCGATGFIGRHLHHALAQAGHTVIPASTRGQPGGLAVDFVRDTQPAVWLPRLQGVDAVVNAVGVLRDQAVRPMWAIHAETPHALFDACAQAGIRRVVHVSALGLEGNPTQYARSKLRAEAQLMALTAGGALEGVIVRPSVVFGRGGASSELFMMLARSPLWLLPAPVVRTRIQPVAVTDLAALVTALVSMPAPPPATISAVGPQALTIAAFLALLRQRMGHGRAWQATLPDWLTSLSARLGDLLPISPWCSETLALLSHDNVAPVTAVEQALGRSPMSPDQFPLSDTPS
ncbi:MAG: NAD-dependent epimerase/dehydratase family protein [Aquabacterium sp.]|nr:NAD-dependent epimerase/dehydratase family protein [Aquabacterium sp.]MBP6614976.1 NAD-dependent epimerase/dehydratase family protein [Aquabacterium sp.]